MKKKHIIIGCIAVVTLAITTALFFFQDGKFQFQDGKFQSLKPKNGNLEIALKKINDGNAHYFKVRAADGIMVSFFTLKSKDGTIRVAIDACDVCYRAGKGYIQEGDFMVCENCGRRFPASKINVVKGGCNPAPLERQIVGSNLVIAMDDINKNSWYAQYKTL